jgi:hypothetical protein
MAWKVAYQLEVMLAEMSTPFFHFDWIKTTWYYHSAARAKERHDQLQEMSIRQELDKVAEIEKVFDEKKEGDEPVEKKAENIDTILPPLKRPRGRPKKGITQAKNQEVSTEISSPRSPSKANENVDPVIS